MNSTLDERYQNALNFAEQNQLPPDSLSRECVLFILHRNCNEPTVAEACELHKDEEYRHIIEALLLAKTTPLEFEKIGISSKVIETYIYLFFDVTKFKHDLQRKRYVDKLNIETGRKNLYMDALDRGPSTILNRYRVGDKPDLDPEKVVKEILHDSYDRFASHRGFNICSDSAKEALKWGNSAINTAKMLIDNAMETKKINNAFADLKISLNMIDQTKKLTDLNIKKEDLVKS